MPEGYFRAQSLIYTESVSLIINSVAIALPATGWNYWGGPCSSPIFVSSFLAVLQIRNSWLAYTFVKWKISIFSLFAYF